MFSIYARAIYGNRNGSSDVKLFNAERSSRDCEFLVTPCIAGEIITAPCCDELVKRLPLKLNYTDSDLFNSQRCQINVLIGNDVYHEFVNVTESQVLSRGLVLLKSFFG